LQKRGKEWYLDFPYEVKTELSDLPVMEQKILAVDLGVNSACTCSCLLSDGTVVGRRFLRLPAEEDCLWKAVNRIKKAQQHGARKTPRLWAVANGINDDIAVKTARFIVGCAEEFGADVIVFEHLDTSGKKKGSKKQRLHLWKAKYVQAMTESKAHRIGIRISRVCAWGTSRLAYDGSGKVKDGISKLSSGATKLADGMDKYNKDGIKSLTTVVRDAMTDFTSIRDRFKAITSEDLTYTSYSGLADGMKGNVKFVISTEEIKAAEK
jgi:IS605 OrfB family transposase